MLWYGLLGPLVIGVDDWRVSDDHRGRVFGQCFTSSFCFSVKLQLDARASYEALTLTEPAAAGPAIHARVFFLQLKNPFAAVGGPILAPVLEANIPRHRVTSRAVSRPASQTVKMNRANRTRVEALAATLAQGLTYLIAPQRARTAQKHVSERFRDTWPAK